MWFWIGVEEQDVIHVMQDGCADVDDEQDE
jgi:hypothetical protein